MVNEPTPNVYFMPKNYGGYINIGGYPVKSRSLMESVVLGTFSGIGTFKVLGYIPRLMWQARFLITFLVAVPLIVVALIGIDGLPFTTWIGNFFKFKMSNQISIFYKKIYKSDVTFYSYDSNDDEGFDTDFFQGVINKTKTKGSDRAIAEFEKSLRALKSDESLQLEFVPEESQDLTLNLNMAKPKPANRHEAQKIKQQEKLERKRRKMAIKQLKKEMKHNKKY